MFQSQSFYSFRPSMFIVLIALVVFRFLSKIKKRKMSNMRFNTVSTHPSKKWDMLLVHAIFLWRKITSIVDLCVIAAFFFCSPVCSCRVVHTSRGWKFASITQQVSLFWHRLLSPCCSLTVLYTQECQLETLLLVSEIGFFFFAFSQLTDMNHFAIDVCFLSLLCFGSCWQLLGIGRVFFFCFCFFVCVFYCVTRKARSRPMHLHSSGT